MLIASNKEPSETRGPPVAGATGDWDDSFERGISVTLIGERCTAINIVFNALRRSLCNCRHVP